MTDSLYTYSYVQELKEKKRQDKEITVPEIRKLEKYVKQKRKVAKLAAGDWSQKQLLKAERLLQTLKKQNDMLLEVEN